MTMLAEVIDAVIGIDTHRDTHEVEIADTAGRPNRGAAGQQRQRRVRAAAGRYRRVAPGPRVAVCIEGSRSYGIGLARALAAAGLLVIECEQPRRKQRRGKGKSDPIDAHLAVLAALRLEVNRLPLHSSSRRWRWWHVTLGDDAASWTMFVWVEEITGVRFVRASYPSQSHFRGQEVLAVQFAARHRPRAACWTRIRTFGPNIWPVALFANLACRETLGMKGGNVYEA